MGRAEGSEWYSESVKDEVSTLGVLVLFTVWCPVYSHDFIEDCRPLLELPSDSSLGKKTYLFFLFLFFKCFCILNGGPNTQIKNKKETMKWLNHGFKINGIFSDDNISSLGCK